ncbi:hypothetical protein ASF62_11050 [Leifsonia sp. Leaf325]|nr:DUF2510 domain-containing protein [Leifsonia sp. Leaf325]KQQ94598.1 hypothetical protein ASF62_11050 [Leifsonia sp. Leaf325]
MTTTPADWHPDPTGRFERRYWDGDAWTGHVWSAGQQGVDPLAPAENEHDAGVSVRDTVMSIETTETKSATTQAAVMEPVKKLSRREAKRQGRDEFESTALAAAHGDSNALSELPAAIDAAAKLYRGKALEDKKWEVLTLGIRDVLDDDLLNDEEEQHLFHLATALGLDLQQLAVRDLPAFEELVIAGLNDGRLPEVEVPVILKAGEVGRAAVRASLMKEVALRETRGGTAGVSIRIAKGVTYRTGQIRARSVVVGTELQVQDTGVLAITNQRAVFVGSARTLEFRYDKLVGIEQFKDGLRLNVSSRQLASLFRISPPASPLIAAAVITHSL